jgi:hypothetical protein
VSIGEGFDNFTFSKNKETKLQEMIEIIKEEQGKNGL